MLCLGYGCNYVHVQEWVHEYVCFRELNFESINIMNEIWKSKINKKVEVVPLFLVYLSFKPYRPTYFVYMKYLRHNMKIQNYKNDSKRYFY